MDMQVALIIPAAGASQRYKQAKGGLHPGVQRSKLDEDLGGRPVLQRTVELFAKHETVGPLIATTIVAGPHDEETFAEFKLRHADRLGLLGAKLCRGGVTHRYESVAAALAFLKTLPEAGSITHVAIHDAARPCTPASLIETIFAAAQKHPGVVPGVACSDTIKRIVIEQAEADIDPLAAILGAAKGPAKRQWVTQTVERAGLVLVQTPQVFRWDVLRRAYEQRDLSSTDDASLVERLFDTEKSQQRVLVVEGDARNIKITTPDDLVLARAILGVKGPDEKPAHLRF
ncbi:MAG: 2-C-methyl-D-erythritol 4-phosphate cytidylyltransferase [Planctomycetota bacterium]|nr:2-C-methyl-D-erythritol 4-phosphate cytidylyltransferase [Planctomycetota bacterium]